jgi:anti-sigma B factor antagonist
MPGGLSLDVDRRDAEAPSLVIVGEIDIATAPALEEAANALLDSRPRRLVLDFGGVPFCDSSGIGVLVRLYNRAILVGCRLTVRNPAPNVRVVFEMTSLTRILRIEPDTSTTG